MYGDIWVMTPSLVSSKHDMFVEKLLLWRGAIVESVCFCGRGDDFSPQPDFSSTISSEWWQ